MMLRVSQGRALVPLWELEKPARSELSYIKGFQTELFSWKTALLLLSVLLAGTNSLCLPLSMGKH